MTRSPAPRPPARVLVWHRRDLRLDDNPAMHAAATLAGETVGLFVFDPAILNHPDTEGGKVDFMLACLRELRDGYRDAGSELLFACGDPVTVVPQLAADLGATHLHFNRDVEPYAIARDRAVREACQTHGLQVTCFTDIGLHDPRAIKTKTDEPYQVFTPFWRNWSQQPKPDPLPRPDRLHGIAPEAIDRASIVPLPSLADLQFAHSQDLPPGGEAEAQRLLAAFCDGKGLLRYDSDRDFPAQEGTSRLSPHLRFGTVGIRRVWAATVAASDRARSDEDRAGIATWRQELAWREFYQQALFHFPHLAEQAHRPEMRLFPWDDDRDRFAAWCAGQTGYPIVDAAMRQLNATGWMHNRCRMIVASFLTKDLLLNWQWGERYFMQKLIDGDLTANNGGWQWSASSGMDPKPLRIFNPATQAKKYDPEGEYIRRWVPELRGLETEELLSGTIADYTRRDRGYPAPLVNHQQQQQIFKARYKLVKPS